MDFNKITLPDLLLAELYKQHLVVIDTDIDRRKKTDVPPVVENAEEMIVVSEKLTETPLKTTPENIAFLGSNKRGISIIVNDPTAIHVADESLDFLSAILAACRLNLADVAIVNINRQHVTASSLRKELTPSSVVLFGVATNTLELPFSIPDYKVQAFDGCNYLQAAPLEKMKGTGTDAKLEKSKLWVCLKNLFAV